MRTLRTVHGTVDPQGGGVSVDEFTRNDGSPLDPGSPKAVSSYGGRLNTESFFTAFSPSFTAVDKRPKLLRPRKLWGSFQDL